MKRFSLLLTCIFFILTSCCLWVLQNESKTYVTKSSFPHEEYALAQQYGHFGEGLNIYKKAVQDELQRMKKKRSVNTPWTLEGPTNVGGRINCIAVHPTNTNTYFVGCSEGGIFKTTNGGTNWTPIFDNAWSLSVSSLIIDSLNPQVMYAGTGDQVLGGYSHVGNGVYKSTDGGATWQNIGLTNVGMIAKLVLNPLNSQILYAAATGNPFTADNNRGLYKSTDGGGTWNQVLFLNQNTGVDDIAINTINPDTLFCSGRFRFRSNQTSQLVGPKTKIYRSFNGGTTWDTLTSGLPSTPTCLIGLAIPSNSPNTIYANYIDDSYDYGGLYKSTNNGNSWSLINTTSANMGGFGWYFGEVRINPFNNSQMYICGVDLARSTNSGSTFAAAGSTHSDKHDVAFVSSSVVLLATDGGFYKSTNGGTSYTLMNNFPITQFYRVAYNSWTPSEYYGGAQDNGSNVGSSTSGIQNWQKYYGGDGFQSQFDANDPDVFYAEWQNGNIVATTDGGNSFNDIFTSVNAVERCSWNTPYFVSKFNSNELFAGTYRVHKNTSGPVDNWFPISPDLTDGTPNTYHVITSLDQSPLNQQYLYAGTSDARVWYTSNGGTNWTQINTGLPSRYVSSVKASPASTSSIFVTLSGYRNNDTMPHVYYSSNNGSTWTSIAGNLPNFSINDIWIRPGSNDSSLVIASDGGVYATTNRGQTWYRVGSNMPIIPVFDIDMNLSTQRVFVGTFARSMQSMPVDSVFNVSPFTVAVQNVENKSHQLMLYPNPVVNNLTMESDQPIHEIIIYNLWGVVQRKVKISAKQYTLNLSSLQTGQYLIELKNENQSSIHKVTKL